MQVRPLFSSKSISSRIRTWKSLPRNSTKMSSRKWSSKTTGIRIRSLERMRLRLRRIRIPRWSKMLLLVFRYHRITKVMLNEYKTLNNWSTLRSKKRGPWSHEFDPRANLRAKRPGITSILPISNIRAKIKTIKRLPSKDIRIGGEPVVSSCETLNYQPGQYLVSPIVAKLA